MKILGREQLWIHTHFLTDCTRLPEFRMREILKEMGPFLRESGIVFGLHFTQAQNERTCRIVLECIPFTQTLKRIQHKLQEVVRDIPTRPAVTKVVQEEKPRAVLASRVARPRTKKGRPAWPPLRLFFTPVCYSTVT